MLSVEEYFTGEYDPEFEYVDGELIATNIGELRHSAVKANLVYHLAAKYRDTKKIFPSLTTKITETRFRLIDVCVTQGVPSGLYLEEPPVVAIEILSEQDRPTEFLAKLADYAALGVSDIWVVDPTQKQMYVFENGSMVSVSGNVIASAKLNLELTREEIFDH